MKGRKLPPTPAEERPALLVLASTYPRWRDDPEPAFVHELCRRLTNRFRVTAVVPGSPGADPDGLLDGVEVIRYRYAPRSLQTLVNNGGIAVNLRRHPWKYLLVPGFVLGQYRIARRLLKSRRFDAVHAHWLIPQGLVARRLARFGLPYLVTSHGGDLFGLRGGLLQALKRRVAASAAAMTVVSSAMVEEVRRSGLRPPALSVIPMGVDLQCRFTPDATVERRPDSLLFVGRLVAKKGLEHLFAAMPRILARRPDARLTIAGFGPEESALRARAERLGVSAHIDFVGAQPQRELPGLYRRASVFVAPFVRDASGNQEGLPVVLMEAIGCGCPAVVGDVLGIRDLLGDQAARICVDPRDTVSLADAVLDALEHPEDAQQRAAALRAAALERVDWQCVADLYADQLAACIRHSGTSR